MSDEIYSAAKFRAAVRLMDGYRRLLNDANSDPELLNAYTAIVRYLHALPDYQIAKILGDKRAGSEARAKRDAAEAAASSFSLVEIENILNSEETTRVQLEAIAIGRFQVPRGSMRSLGNIDNLREKLSTLVQNERAHAAISDVARDSK
jgi:hypothetical protein